MATHSPQYPLYQQAPQVQPAIIRTVVFDNERPANQPNLPIFTPEYKDVRKDIERCKRVIDTLSVDVNALRTSEKNLNNQVADQKAEIHALSLLASALANASRFNSDEVVNSINNNITTQGMINRLPADAAAPLIRKAEIDATVCEAIDGYLRDFINSYPLGFEIVKLAAGVYSINGERVRITWNGSFPVVTVSLETIPFDEFVAPIVNSVVEVNRQTMHQLAPSARMHEQQEQEEVQKVLTAARSPNTRSASRSASRRPVSAALSPMSHPDQKPSPGKGYTIPRAVSNKGASNTKAATSSSTGKTPKRSKAMTPEELRMASPPYSAVRPVSAGRKKAAATTPARRAF